jgi:peroxiredoxin
LKAKGLNVVGINRGDSPETIEKYAKESGTTFPLLVGGQGSIFEQYHVEGYPTSYLLSAQGKVVYRSLGVDEQGLQAALKQMGLK